MDCRLILTPLIKQQSNMSHQLKNKSARRCGNKNASEIVSAHKCHQQVGTTTHLLLETIFNLGQLARHVQIYDREVKNIIHRQLEIMTDVRWRSKNHDCSAAVNLIFLLGKYAPHDSQ